MFKIWIDCHHLKDQKGIARYLLNLLKYWTKEKEIKFILYFEDKDDTYQLVPQSTNFQIRKLKSPFGISSTALFQHFLLSHAAERDKVDILFSPSYLLPLFYRGKTAVAIHDIIYETHPEWFHFRGFQDRILLKWMGRMSAKKADIIFTPSEFTKKEVHKAYELELHKIIVTPLAADGIFYNQKKERENPFLKRKYGIQKSYFLFAAAIFERRCVGQSIRAFRELALKYPDFQYLIIGQDHTKSQEISQIVREVNKTTKRKAVIYQNTFVSSEELANLYHGAYATIYNSLYEGFGLPIIESMACGTPVICGNAKVFQEVVGKSCFWVKDPCNISEVAKMMEKAILDRALYDRVRTSGLKRANQFSWEKCANKTLKVLKNIKDKK